MGRNFMAQPIASDRYILAPGTLSDAPEKLPAFNPDPIAAAAAAVPAPMSTPATIDGGTFGSGPDTLVMTLAEDAFQGDAQANIAIDGMTLNAQPLTVTALKSAGQSETLTFKGTFGSGAHDLAVSFLNDAYGGAPAADRNLYVNGASYDGFSTRPATAALDTTGTTHFTIPPAGDPEAVPTTTDGGTFGSGPDTLVLTLAEDAFQGDAQANIAIDGMTLNAQPLTVTALKSAGQSETFTFKGTFGSGAHDLAVSFLNDAYGGAPTADRNLYVNGASYDGIATRPATAALDTTGTTRFTIPPAGDPEAVPTTADGGTFGSGPHTSVLTAPGQSVASNLDDTFDANGQADTRFVFTAGFGQDAVQNFVSAGHGHDILDLPHSDFTSIADVLRNTDNAAGGAVIHDPTTQDTIKVAGVSKTELARHKNDFMFHA